MDSWTVRRWLGWRKGDEREVWRILCSCELFPGVIHKNVQKNGALICLVNISSADDRLSCSLDMVAMASRSYEWND